MAYTPLATVANLTNTPLNDVFRNFSAPEQTNLLARASRSIEALTNSRLAPFTITETHRAQGIDPDAASDFTGVPMDWAGSIGASRAASLGATDLVQHVFLHERPRRFLDMWAGSINSIMVYRNIGGSQSLIVASQQYEVDTGHVRFQLGSFIPAGSIISVTYSGGYSPAVPDDLIQATIYKAAEMAIVDLLPEDRPGVDLMELREMVASLIAPYVAE